jgi:hypothetical protein
MATKGKTNMYDEMLGGFGSLKSLEVFGFHKKWNPESNFGLVAEKKFNSSFGSSSGSGNQSWFWSGSS